MHVVEEMKPLFSCVIPVKGKQPFFDEAIASLRNQGMDEDLEIIIQDADVEPDRGQSDALNKGFAKANGAWLFWLNADDVLLPGALTKVRNVIASQESKVCWIAGNEYFIDADGKRVGCSIGCGWHDWLFHHAVPHVNGPSAFFRRELFEKVGGFNASLNFCMDWDLWIRFMKAGAQYVRINDFLWEQRRWLGSKTQRNKTKEEDHLHWAEVNSMAQKNGLTLSRSGTWLIRTWRMLSGCYLKEFLTQRRATSRAIPQNNSNRVAVMIMHQAPYRDPVLEELVTKCPVDIYSVFANDKGHAWAGFGHNVPTLAGNGLTFRLSWQFAFSKKYTTVLWPAYHPWWLTLPISLSALLGKRYGMTSDTKEENGGRFAKLIKQYLYRHAAFIWVPGKAAKQFLVNNYKISEDRITEGLFLVDPSIVTRNTRKNNGARKKFLMVANDIPGRRIDILVEGFRRARKQDEILTLCGAGGSKFTGDGVVGLDGVAWNDLMKLYDGTDVYVHNGMEQYSTAVQIAALRGLPIICSCDVGIVADFNNPEKSMLLVYEWQNVEAWETAFNRMRERTPETVMEMGAHVSHEAAQRYSVKTAAEAVAQKLIRD